MELIALWTLALAVLIAALLRTPEAKGRIGEAVVAVAAWLRLSKATYHSLHNVTLPTADGTTQIDHIIVSQYGIFVIETKYLRGWIFGRPDEAQWTQRLERRSYRFQNPLRQNFKHTRALQAVLNWPEAPIHSLVVLAGDARLKLPRPPNVLYGGSYITYVKSFKVPVLTVQQVEQTLARIEARRLAPSRVTDREHVRNVRSRSDPNAQRKCPRCGSAMILRSAGRGSGASRRFWGCSGFPRCRQTQRFP